MMDNVPKADVVIVNPTHYAVALEYKMDTMEAPVVLAKGIDNIALRIKAIAEEHEIPVVENPPLARALFASAGNRICYAAQKITAARTNSSKAA